MIDKSIASGVVTSGSNITEVEDSAGILRPSMEVELMEAEFVADSSRVPTRNPGQIVGKLGTIDRFKPETLPIHTELRVRSAPGKRNVRWPGGIVKQPTPVCPPQSILPVLVGGQRTSAHKPAVPGNGRVVEQIVANDVVELLIGVLRRDALEEAVSKVILVCRRVCRRRAAQHFAAVADRRTRRPIETRCSFEFFGNLVIDPEDESS